jgi:hypothetical protein
MRHGTSGNSDRRDSSTIRGEQRDEAGRTEDFAFVARFCVIGTALSYAAIAGAPDFVLTIAKAFAAFCCVSPGA